jgi:hypothetical protein
MGDGEVVRMSWVVVFNMRVCYSCLITSYGGIMGEDLHSHITEVWEEDDVPMINEDGAFIWLKNGLYHRDGDMPAVILANGDQKWYQNDLCHRDNDLPAVVFADGSKRWFKRGLLHRDNGKPAVIFTDGSGVCYRDGKMIR